MLEGARLNPLVSQVVIAGLQREGIRLPPTIVPADLSAPVTRAEQYALLELADRSLAPVGVLQIGKTLTSMLEDFPNPLLFVLLNQNDVDDFLEQVARLNRFLHSAHRHEVLARSERFVRLRHVSLQGGAPEPLESRFVFGLYLALLEEIGCQGLRAALGDPEREAYASGAFTPAPDSMTAADLWHFRWDAFSASRKPLPGLQQFLLRSPPEDLEQPASLRGRVEAEIRKDLCARHSVADIAKRLAISTRSLQRQLRAEDVSFSEVVETCRVHEACRLLRQTTMSVTEIGFTCGFSDTAHFSRRFKLRVGEPPTAYRDRPA